MKQALSLQSSSLRSAFNAALAKSVGLEPDQIIPFAGFTRNRELVAIREVRFRTGKMTSTVAKFHRVLKSVPGDEYASGRSLARIYKNASGPSTADGSTAGNPEKIKQMIAWRSVRLEATRELIRRSRSKGMSKANIVDLKRWKESVRTRAKQSSNCAHGDRHRYRQIQQTILRGCPRHPEAHRASPCLQ